MRLVALHVHTAVCLIACGCIRHTTISLGMCQYKVQTSGSLIQIGHAVHIHIIHNIFILKYLIIEKLLKFFSNEV